MLVTPTLQYHSDDPIPSCKHPPPSESCTNPIHTHTQTESYHQYFDFFWVIETFLEHNFLVSLEKKKMATFGGTTQKCKACEKTVYLVDELTADNKVYHKSCFRCHHCKGTLKLSNYSSFEGVLYCKPHFDQLFKMTGSLDKSFEGAPKTVRERSVDQGQSNTRVSRMFGGTQDKCVTCQKTVYPLEKVGVDGTSYHKVCFRCSHGGCVISPSNYVAHEHQLYCKHHAAQLFKAKGDFSQLTKQTEQVNGVTENTASV